MASGARTASARCELLPVICEPVLHLRDLFFLGAYDIGRKLPHFGVRPVLRRWPRSRP